MHIGATARRSLYAMRSVLGVGSSVVSLVCESEARIHLNGRESAFAALLQLYFNISLAHKSASKQNAKVSKMFAQLDMELKKSLQLLSKLLSPNIKEQECASVLLLLLAATLYAISRVAEVLRV